MSIAIFPTLIFLAYTSDSCGIKHISIMNNIDQYEQSLDPEFCEEIVFEIDRFNESCKPYVEILDCG